MFCFTVAVLTLAQLCVAHYFSMPPNLIIRFLTLGLALIYKLPGIVALSDTWLCEVRAKYPDSIELHNPFL